MTIKQQGGVFGRNPSFNDVEVVDLTATGDISADEFNGRRASLTEQVTINRSGANDTVLQMSNSTAAFFVTQSGNGSTYILNYGNQKMYFGMNGAEDFHLDTNGNINMVQGGGNLIMANGAGIDFSATSGTGTSELFDDYEEGTWTPVIDSATAGSDRVTLVREARYTKIGNMVHATAYVELTTLGTGGSGAIVINGLPYTAVSGAGGNYFSSSSVGFFSGLAANVNYISGTVQPSSTSIFLRGTTAAAASVGVLAFSTYAAVSMQLMISTQYNTA